MIPRGKLDIPYSMLFKAIGYCIAEPQGVKKAAEPTDNTITCLSVRTGLDLTLRSLNLPSGSEILVSNINIPDMFAIIKAHQLESIPLAVNKHHLNLSAAQMASKIGPTTRAILITHLFGAITEVDALIKIAKQHKLIVIEDCAQAFDGSYTGHPQSDVVMFSFGLIKTNTSLTAAVLRVNNSQLYEKIVSLNGKLPLQHTNVYLKKIGKSFVLKLLTSRLLYTLLYRLSKWKNQDFDDLLSGFTRGFPGNDVLTKIRFRPCQANVSLLRNRLATFNKTHIEQRTHLANEILKAIPEDRKVGHLSALHTHWVLPIRTNNPEHLIASFRRLGIDATAKASSLVQLPVANTLDLDDLDLDELVYLPIHSDTRRLISGYQSLAGFTKRQV